MISQQELPAYIENRIPELSDICQHEQLGNAYHMVRHLLKYTVSQVAAHNLKAAKHCLSVAEQLYKKGNAAIRNAIENVYVFSFSHAFFCDDDKRKEMMKIVPASLYDLYKKQVVNSHL